MLHRLKGGGFGLRLKAGSVRRWADRSETHVTLKLSSGSGGFWFLDILDPTSRRSRSHWWLPNSRWPTGAGPSSACAIYRTRSAACVNCAPSGAARLAIPTGSAGSTPSVCTWSRLIDPACTTISCACAVSRSSSRRVPTSPQAPRNGISSPKPGDTCSPKPCGCHACMLPSTQSIPEAPQSQPPKGVGFTDPLSGTLKCNCDASVMGIRSSSPL